MRRFDPDLNGFIQELGPANRLSKETTQEYMLMLDGFMGSFTNRATPSQNTDTEGTYLKRFIPTGRIFQAILHKRCLSLC
jgi:hypothetical protein